MTNNDIVLLQSIRMLLDAGMDIDSIALKVTEDITTSSKYRLRKKIKSLYSEHIEQERINKLLEEARITLDDDEIEDVDIELVRIMILGMMTEQGLSITEILDFYLSQFSNDEQREDAERFMLSVYREYIEGTPEDKRTKAQYQMSLDVGLVKKQEPLTIRSLLKECGVKLDSDNNEIT